MLRLLLAAATVLAGITAANAAQISIVSMQYSAAQPVPHIHYEGGTEGGDVAQLQQVYDSFVKCRTECLGGDGGSTAVLTMNGPGGSYYEGLALADFIRANHITTVIERGMTCYSACAFAFLGGSGYSSMQRYGTYVDRQIEPGAILGFHAPYRDEASFLEALEQRGAGEVMTESRDSLSRMVRELVKWNVDPEIIHYMMGMGPDKTYDIVNADDYYLVRASLPPTRAQDWITDLPEAVKNACMRLLAISERGDPLSYRNFFDMPYQELGTTESGDIVSGYRWSDELLNVGSCGLDNAAAGITDKMHLATYFTPGLAGTIAPDTNYWNVEQGWSSAGAGRNPLKDVFQKGALNHYFLPVGVNIDSLDLPGEMSILWNRFFTAFPPALPVMDPRLEVVSSDADSRVSRLGDIWVFEQTGPKLLFDTAAADPGLGLNLTNNGTNTTGFVREGTYADGTPFKWFGFANGDAATVVRMFVSRTDGTPATTDEIALMHELQCAADFQGLKLGCG
ncbi:MAG TPA: hypothetical protein VGD86_10000 [Devosia sp.]